MKLFEDISLRLLQADDAKDVQRVYLGTLFAICRGHNIRGCNTGVCGLSFECGG